MAATLPPVSLSSLGARRARRAISGRSAFPSLTRNYSNASTFTQIQQKMALDITDNVTDLAFTWGNFFAAGPSGTAFDGPSAITIRAGLWDGTTAIPIYWTNGSRDITLSPGAVCTTRPIFYAAKAGVRLWLIYMVTMATAWTNIPAATVPSWTTNEGSEGSATNALTDRTTVGSTPGGRLVNWAIFPPLAITGTPQANKPVVAILGDSITSDGSNDTSMPWYYQGWAMRGLSLAGIPFVSIGETSLQQTQVASSRAVRRARFSALVDSGATHILAPMGTNDWNVPRTAAQLYADHQTVATEASYLGLKYVMTTLQPRTNAANAAQNGSETVTWAQRAIFNANVIANNGVGNGYYNLAAITQSSGATDLWRTDLLNIAASGIAVTSGGSGYAAGDYLFLPGGALVQISTVTSGAITTLGTIYHSGGFTTAPSGPVAQVSTYRYDTTVPAGTGATFTLTTQAVNPPTTDGIHPAPSLHYIAAADFASNAAALFS